MPEALHLDVQVGAVADGVPDPARRCAFCARPGAFQGQDNTQATCPLCWLVRDLGRPRIDEEARLIWLPEAGQSVINVLCREIHIELYRLLEPLCDDAVPRLDSEASTRLYYARVALAAREDAAVSRLGSTPTDAQLIASAMRAAPARVAKDATIVAMEADGKMRTLREGKNGFTCMPDNPADAGPRSDVHGQERDGLGERVDGEDNAAGRKDRLHVHARGRHRLQQHRSVRDQAGEEQSLDQDRPARDDRRRRRRVSTTRIRRVADPDTSAPYVMWPGTPYQHLMAPVR